MYSFVVTDAKNISWQRICDEAPADVDVILVPNNAENDQDKAFALLVRQSWLSKFHRNDELTLMGNTLGSWWGDSFVKWGFWGNRLSLVSHVMFTEALEGWRALRMTGDATGLIGELQAARKFQRRITVKVHYI